MSKKLFLVFSLLMVFAMLLSACGQKTATVTEVATEAPVVSTGPELITGEMTYSNDFAVEYYFYEQMAALTDMHGFVIRDREWELPVESQALGYMKVDGDNNKASYRLALPIKPEGVLNDVDNNGKEDKGVQIFAVTYSPNLTGGPYADGDDKSLGWPGYIGSVVIDSELNDEVVGGKLVIWAPDAAQQFPTGFGDDSLLFTKDDPVGPIPAGYSIVDLDQKPFAFSQEVNPQIALLEPKDYAIKDFSALSYTEAFDKMFNTLKAEYAFNDQPGKAPKWDELYKELAPRVKDAEAKKDAKAYFLAIK
ncbi:MAG: peptidase S41, partial [Anaerolineaceae bacterium]|nr:peptidase S41 [Anaerolineaceae bacterium]